MNLVLTTFGTYLHRRGEMFLIKVKEESTEISARKIRSILITTGASLSTDAIELALEKNIDVIFLDKFGAPMGRIFGMVAQVLPLPSAGHSYASPILRRVYAWPSGGYQGN